jgi:hypothetical protein
MVCVLLRTLVVRRIFNGNGARRFRSFRHHARYEIKGVVLFLLFPHHDCHCKGLAVCIFICMLIFFSVLSVSSRLVDSPSYKMGSLSGLLLLLSLSDIRDFSDREKNNKKSFVFVCGSRARELVCFSYGRCFSDLGKMDRVERHLDPFTFVYHHRAPGPKKKRGSESLDVDGIHCLLALAFLRGNHGSGAHFFLSLSLLPRPT